MSGWHAEDLPTLRALAEVTSWAFADSGGLVGGSCGVGSGARCIPHRQDSAPGAQQAEAHGEIGQARCPANTSAATGGLLGVGGAPVLWTRSDGVRHRVGRAARQDAHPVERGRSAGSRRTEPGTVGIGVIQIAPQMRILVAIEPVDGRKGIDSLARLCQDKLRANPFSGCLFVFRSRRGTSIRILVYDGQAGAETAVAGTIRVVADPTVLKATSVTEGAFLGTGGPTIFLPGTIDNVGGLNYRQRRYP